MGTRLYDAQRTEQQWKVMAACPNRRRMTFSLGLLAIKLNVAETDSPRVEGSHTLGEYRETIVAVLWVGRHSDCTS